MELNKIHHGDCLKGLKQLPDNSVNMVLTSPPYWALRDYTGDIENEIGKEKHPSEYVNRIVEVMKECMRVLKDDGNIFLNIGDSFGSHRSKDYCYEHKTSTERNSPARSEIDNWYRNKQKLLIPHRIAIALQDLGYIVRDDIVWAKKVTIYPEKTSVGNQVPFPIKDRFCATKEYIFHVVKNEKYYFNLKPAKIQPKLFSFNRRNFKDKSKMPNTYDVSNFTKMSDNALPSDVIMFKKKNEITRKYVEGNYAMFPESLAEVLIGVGSKEGDTVLDQFMGCGTTAVMAKLLGRNYIGFELSEEFCKQAEYRLSKI